ncbi:hypothetical protein BABINDRAFT_161307 [Babjeviella inositovora NRRL Y-12698]|uniref:Uncharacterized protein n=1 Tax=Babjeviella inositovora NRRL Y-12698 TaxID=984486 RepID=A0A1E3QTT1_9ASCO|nr:uncharacterized protein BABINDRAFT_161307 [Babjeviella inositovora NRRL Y-12698]ODQ80357.1 hypothetical protein BABINDRAFT_161307 [Babjeviella inositovora NRRL Y-12698]
MSTAFFSSLKATPVKDAELPLHDRGRLAKPSGIVTLSYNATGSRLLVTRTDRSLRVWQTAADRVPTAGATIEATHDKPAEMISWHPAHEFTFATIGLDADVKIWDCATLKKDKALLKTLRLGSSKTRLLFVAYSGLGRWLACVDKENNVYLLDTTQGYHVAAHFQIRRDNVYSVAWCNTDDYLFVGLGDGSIAIYEVEAAEGDEGDDESSEAVVKQEGGEAEPKDVVMEAETKPVSETQGTSNASEIADKHIVTTPLVTVSVTAYLPSQRSAVTALAFDPRGTYLASGSQAGVLTLFPTDTLIPTHIVTDCDEPITDLDTSMEGTFVAACFEKEPVRVYETNGGLVQKYVVPESSGWKSWLRTCYAKVAWCPARTEFAYVGDDGKLAVVMKGVLGKEKREH